MSKLISDLYAFSNLGGLNVVLFNPYTVKLGRGSFLRSITLNLAFLDKSLRFE